MIAWVDFETRSRCDLRECGVYNYALDPTTEVLCMAYAIDDGEVQLWLPGDPMPSFDGCQIRARNAAFERLIFTHVLNTRYPLESYYCTAAQAAANCLPRSLEDTGRAISSTMRKDYRGAGLIRKLCIPQADGSFNDDPTLMQELYDYCMQDVRADREISQSLRELSEQELADYHVNERINDRGVKVDVALCEAAERYAAQELKEAQEVFTAITGLSSVRSPKMRQWVMAHVGPMALELMKVYKNGVQKFSVDKTVRANLLSMADEYPDEVPEDVCEVLSCADDVWASSVAKFTRLKNLSCPDGRVRGAFVFNGGAATGRASSYGAQVHNFTRKCAKDPVAVREDMLAGNVLVPKHGKRVADVLKGMLRPALIPDEGNVFIVADWSGIEARVNPWLTGSPEAEPVLDVFRNNEDIYIREAAGIFSVSKDEVTDSQRQIGKVAVLSCGFGGGHNAFAAMGKNYGVVLAEADNRRTVGAWRSKNLWAVEHWGRLEAAYYAAMRVPGRVVKAGRVAYMFVGGNLWYALPSGRVLCYPQARFEKDGSISYLKAAWKPAADAKEWPRARLWHGLACENTTQAVANDLLRHLLRGLVGVVLHVHDEVVLEVPEAQAQEMGEALATLMTTPPPWASGLPLAVGWKIMTRYGK